MIPLIENRWACIGTNAEIALLSTVCSCLRQSGTYLPVFGFPSVDFPYSPSSDFGKDGYFARLIGYRAAHHINNALARIQPQSILIIGLTETQKSYLRPYLPYEKLVEMTSVTDIHRLLPLVEATSESILCRPAQIIEGLLLAKFSKKRLVVDNNAPPLPSKHLHGNNALLVIENGEGVDEVAAVNYAFSIDADVLLVPPFNKQQLRSLPRQLLAWSNDNSHHEFAKFKRSVSKKLTGIDFMQYSFATFFTSGVPYGLFVKNAIPCTHVLKDIDCGVFIANNLIEEHSPMKFGSALVFSPQMFDSEENEQIRELLDDANFTVKLLLGSDATVQGLSNYGSFYPFDVLHICAHGGETDGYFVTREFTDRMGESHKFEFYEVVGFAPATPKKVLVTRKAIFKTFDGFPWMSDPLMTLPHYVFEDMLKALRSKEDAGETRVRFNSPIASSCHIQCHDSIHQGDFHCLAGVGYPLVFNNTCSSSHELAASFIDAGARGYVGTLWSVGNETAKRAATVFYAEAAEHRNILKAFVAMNKSIKNKKYQNVYILWGLHFSSFPRPTEKSDRKVFDALLAGYFMYSDKSASSPDIEVRQNSIPIAKFLISEILNNFPRNWLNGVPHSDFDEIEGTERGVPARAWDDFSRGISEVDLPRTGRSTKTRVPTH